MFSEKSRAARVMSIKHKFNNRYRQETMAIFYVYDNVSAAMLIWKAQQRFVRFCPILIMTGQRL